MRKGSVVGKAEERAQGRPVAIDLFCGAGGMSLGFEQAGFDVLLGVDVDGHHVAVHERNFPYGKSLCRSVAELTGRDLIATLGGRADVDLIFGGPPCQGFSTMGVRDAKDPRNTLVRQFVRIVGEVMPKAFVMENVPGMLTGESKPVLADAIEYLRRAGYRVVSPARVLDASAFGVPQKRKRLILMGLRDDLAGVLEYPTAAATGQPARPTVWEAIGDLPDVDADDELFEQNDARFDRLPMSPYARVMRGLDADPSDFSYPRLWNRAVCTGCLRVRHTSKAVALYAATPPGTMVPGHKLPRLDPAGIAPTLRAGSDSTHGSYTAPRPVHPDKPRCITAREAARLHGFPDWFSLYPLKWHAYRQIGNAVCPPVAKAIGRQVLATLGVTPIKPKLSVALSDAFALPEDRPRTLKRIPQMAHFPPVIAHLFEAAFDAKGQKLSKGPFTFADVQGAIAATNANLPWTRADTFVPEIARSRNVRRILESCLTRGFTVRQVTDGYAIGEFVPVGHPEGIDEKGFLRVSSRELGDADALDLTDRVRLGDPETLFASLEVAEVVAGLWGDRSVRVRFEPSQYGGPGTASLLYQLATPSGPVGRGCAVAFKLGNVPNRARLSRIAKATDRDELIALIPITTKHVLATRLEGCLTVPKEAGRLVFDVSRPDPASKPKAKGISRAQPSLF